MAILLIDNLATDAPVKAQSGIVLKQRAVIGRWETNDVCLPHASVSRLHAWICCRDGQYILTDMNSRTGTRVNGEPLIGPHELRHDDEIVIGSCRIAFRMDDVLPDTVEQLSPPAPASSVAAESRGIVFDCACGAPAWAPLEFAGKEQKCVHCNQRIVIPTASGEVAGRAPRKKRPEKPSAKRAAPVRTCSICQWTVDETAATTRCDECGHVFHEECWIENRGCSSYGCSKVNVLDEQSSGEAEAQSLQDSGGSGENETAEQRSPVLLHRALLIIAVVVLTIGVAAWLWLDAGNA